MRMSAEAAQIQRFGNGRAMLLDRTRCGKSWTTTSSAKIWQLAQSCKTEAENLEHDFNEIVGKIWELGGVMKRVTRCCVEKEEENT